MNTCKIEIGDVVAPGKDAYNYGYKFIPLIVSIETKTLRFEHWHIVQEDCTRCNTKDPSDDGMVEAGVTLVDAIIKTSEEDLKQMGKWTYILKTSFQTTGVIHDVHEKDIQSWSASLIEIEFNGKVRRIINHKTGYDNVKVIT